MVFNALWSIKGLSTISGYILIINFDLQHIIALNFQMQAAICRENFQIKLSIYQFIRPKAITCNL